MGIGVVSQTATEKDGEAVTLCVGGGVWCETGPWPEREKRRGRAADHPEYGDGSGVEGVKVRGGQIGVGTGRGVSSDDVGGCDAWGGAEHGAIVGGGKGKGR